MIGDGKKVLKITGNALVFIDWANVHGWTKSLKREVDVDNLYNYLKKYPEIGEDGRVTIRKCDFDMEVCIDVHRVVSDFQTFVFFTGDGDYGPLYKMLVNAGRNVIVIYARGHLGKEIWDIGYGVYKVKINELINLK